MGSLRELASEFRLVLSGRRGSLLDALLPPLLYLIVYPFAGQDFALWFALGIGLLLLGVRLVRRTGLRHALAGFGAVLLAALFVRLSGTGAAFYLPGLITSAVTILACFLSVLFGRPLVAWTSYLTRRWPLAWYWHPQIRPAYSETTFAWGLVFAMRLALEYGLFQQEAVTQLGLARLLLGWPFTIALLAATYLYGLWRLRSLGGPSVEEFAAGSPPPWQGQRRGF